jgi:hypothetical protein
VNWYCKSNNKKVINKGEIEMSGMIFRYYNFRSIVSMGKDVFQELEPGHKTKILRGLSDVAEDSSYELGRRVRAALKIRDFVPCFQSKDIQEGIRDNILNLLFAFGSEFFDKQEHHATVDVYKLVMEDIDKVTNLEKRKEYAMHVLEDVNELLDEVRNACDVSRYFEDRLIGKLTEVHYDAVLVIEEIDSSSNISNNSLYSVLKLRAEKGDSCDKGRLFLKNWKPWDVQVSRNSKRSTRQLILAHF